MSLQLMGHCKKEKSTTNEIPHTRIVLGKALNVSNRDESKPVKIKQNYLHEKIPLRVSNFDADSVSVIMSLCSGVLQLQTVYVGNKL